MICSNFKIDPSTNTLYRVVPVPVPEEKPSKYADYWRPSSTYLSTLYQQRKQTPQSDLYQLIIDAIDLQIYWVNNVLGNPMDPELYVHPGIFKKWVESYNRILTQATDFFDTTENIGIINTFIEEFKQQFGDRAQLDYYKDLYGLPISKQYINNSLGRLGLTYTMTQQINFSHMIEIEYFTVDGVKYIRRKSAKNTYLKSVETGELYIEAVDRVSNKREYEVTDIEIETEEVEVEEKTEETN